MILSPSKRIRLRWSLISWFWDCAIRMSFFRVKKVDVVFRGRRRVADAEQKERHTGDSRLVTTLAHLTCIETNRR